MKRKKEKKICLGKMMLKLVIGHVSARRGNNFLLIVDMGKIHEAVCERCTKKS